DGQERAVAAEDSQTVDDLALLERVVVGKADGRALEGCIVEQLPRQELSRVAGAVDEDAVSRRRPRRRQELAEQAEGQTAAGQQDQEDEPVQDDDDPREALEAEGEQEGQG